MVLEKNEINRLLGNYGTTSDKDIRYVLDNVRIVTNRGTAEEPRYFELNTVKAAEVRMRPREISHAFDPGEPGDPSPGLREMVTIPFYVKSSSRFYLKPDIGEVVDQLEVKNVSLFKAICIVGGSEVMVDTGNYDEFIMEAILLK